MPNAIILGCSHAAGAEMWHDPGVNITDTVKQVEYGAANSYPVLVAQALGFEPKNHAISGGSNDAMFRIFLELLPNLSKKDIVIACWTGSHRTEVWHSEEKFWVPLSGGTAIDWSVKPNPVLLQGHCSPPTISNSKDYQHYAQQWTIFETNNFRGRLNKIKNISALNCIAKENDIVVINVYSFDLLSDIDVPGQWPVNDLSFIDFCEQRKFNKTPWGHYFKNAHQEFSNLIIEKYHEK